jgi:iron complex outermembrane receptor protein
MEKLSRNLKLSGSAFALIAGTTLAVTTVTNGAMAQTATGGSASATSNTLPVEQVVVTGTSIRGAAPVGDHLITLDQQTIQASAPVNLTQMLDSVTSISTNGAAPQGENVNSFYSPQIHDLEGSASNSTLVIVDGLRLPGGGNIGYSQIDPNIVPVSAVERVEVLADGASSVYGSDAVAGVVNYILRKDYDGAEINIQAGQGKDYQTQTYNVLLGHSWDTGGAYFAGGYTYQSPLSVSSHAFLDRGNYAPEGGNNFDEVFGCPTAAIVAPSVGGTAEIFPNVTSTTAVPNSKIPYANCNTTVYGDALAGSKRANGLMRFHQNFGDRFSAQVTLDVNTLTTNYATGPGTLSNVTVYGPTSGKSSATLNQINPFYQAPAGNPTQTGSESVSWVDLLGNGPNGTNFGETIAEEQVLYGTTVLTYNVTDDWEVKFSDAIGWFRNESAVVNGFCSSCAVLALNGTTQSNGSATTSSVAGANVIALNSLNANNALDIWDPAGSTNKTAALVARSLYTGQTEVDDFNSINQSRLETDGPLFSLPAGPVKFATGVEWYLQHLIRDVRANGGTGPTVLDTSDQYYRYDRYVYSAYAEFNIPVISPEMGLPLMQKVDIDISGRYDKYSDVGVTKNPKYAFNWQINDDWKVRANYSTSFVAPPVGVLGDPALGGEYNGGASVGNQFNVPIAAYPTVTQLPGCNTAAVQAQGYCTIGSGTAATGIQRAYGGLLENMKPETGDTWSAGVDFTPTWLPGLTANVTYFWNSFKGGATLPNAEQIVDSTTLHNNLTLCPGGCSAATVEALIRTQEGGSFNGSLPTSVYFTLVSDSANVLYVRVSGIDLTSNYTFTTNWIPGAFHVGENLTEFLTFDENVLGGQYFSILNTSGFNSTFPSVQLQSRSSAGWSNDVVSVDGFLNFTGGYRNVGANTINPVDVNALGELTGGGDIVQSNITVDLHAAYNFPEGLLSGDQLYIDVKNLLGSEPPFYNAAGGSRNGGGEGYDAFVSNPLGRVLSLGLRAKF